MALGGLAFEFTPGVDEGMEHTGCMFVQPVQGSCCLGCIHAQAPEGFEQGGANGAAYTERHHVASLVINCVPCVAS